MADLLDKLNSLNTAYKWLNGAKKIKDSTKTVLETAKSVNEMSKDVRKGGKSASVDWRKLDKTLGSNRKELEALNRHWTQQAKDIQAAADASWPSVKTDARERFQKLIALEKRVGADSPVFEKELDKTIKHLTECRTKVWDRETYCLMVADKCDQMDKAFRDANDAIDQTFKLLNVAFIAFMPVSNSASATAMKHMINLSSTIRNRPNSVARAYVNLAASARSEARRVHKDVALIDGWLKTLARMKLADMARDAVSYLKGLLKAA